MFLNKNRRGKHRDTKRKEGVSPDGKYGARTCPRRKAEEIERSAATS